MRGGGCPLLIGTVFVRLLYFLAEALTEEGIPGWPPDQLNTGEFSEVADRCKQNSTVTNEQVRRFVYTSTMFDDDMAFKCYTYCTWREHGTIMANGKLDQSKLMSSIQALEPEFQLIMLNMGRRCLAQKERNLCDRMYGVMRCMKEADPEHFFLL